MSKQWLLTTGDDGKQHVLHLPDKRLHSLRSSCRCEPTIDAGVVLHRFGTDLRKRLGASA